MIFPRKKPAPVTAPWWQGQTPAKSSKGSVALIAVLAGAAGGILGVNASGASIFNRVNLVSSTSTIERAPDSVAGTAQRVLPSVVSIQTRTNKIPCFFRNLIPKWTNELNRHYLKYFGVFFKLCYFKMVSVHSIINM